MHQLIETHLENEGELAGIINCWPLDIGADPGARNQRPPGVFTILHLVKAFADHDTIRPRLYLLTANAQSVLGTRITCSRAGRRVGTRTGCRPPGVRQPLGRIDRYRRRRRPQGKPRRASASTVFAQDPEDQIATAAYTAYVPRLRASASLTQAFPTKLTPNATYVVTGGAGALGRIVATYLAETGPVISHCCPEARFRHRYFNGRRCPTTTDTTRPSARSARSSSRCPGDHRRRRHHRRRSGEKVGWVAISREADRSEESSTPQGPSMTGFW